VLNNSPASQAALAYQKRDIETADPISLVVRVIELASHYTAKARTAIAEGDMSSKAKQVHQVSRCLDALQSSLDMDRGAEVAGNLDRLYGYMQRRLTEGHLSNDDSVLEEIAGHLSELGSAWREVAQRPTGTGTP
jgi:flagellar protein FliS